MGRGEEGGGRGEGGEGLPCDTISPADSPYIP